MKSIWYNMPLFLWHHVPMTAATSMATTTAKKLNDYFEDWLGESAQSEQQVVHIVEAGLPTNIVSRLLSRGLSKDEVYAVIINPRTLKHRKTKKQKLSRDESERAVRAVRIIARAQSVLGDHDKALHWLRAPKKRFEGRSPIHMLSTETGGRLVEQMLIQIDEGMFA
jgi:putative toxin-antitoxin system antitoxin component (TIGR02293 family)